MTVSFPKLSSAVMVFVCFFAASKQTFSQDQPWKPVSPSEIGIMIPTVEANADAETLFWEVRLDDKKDGKLAYEHYVRVKIFTESAHSHPIYFRYPRSEEDSIEISLPENYALETTEMPNNIRERRKYLFRKGKIPGNREASYSMSVRQK